MNKSSPLRLAAYLGHIQEAIERCHRHVVDMDEMAFLKDTKTQDAVIRTFEVIGEASNNIKKYFPEFATQHPEVPFGMAIGMRNALSHGYFNVDLEIMWKAIHGDLPQLHDTVRSLLDTTDRQ